MTFPLILGLEFLTLVGIKLDFNTATYSLPEGEELTQPFSYHPLSPSITLHMALPTVPISSTAITAIKNLVILADASRTEKRQLESLLLEWSTVCTDTLGHTSIIKHHILTADSLPIRKRTYPVPVNKQQFIDEEIEKMLSKGIIRPSTSPWAAPVVLVPKKDGNTRFCVDYRALNGKTPLDGFPMPQIQEILESLYGAPVFSILDLRTRCCGYG